MLRAGQTVERWTVEAEVGRGAMSIVYRVRHQRLGILSALKVLVEPKPSTRERLLREGRVQGGLRHPNVVGALDVVDIEGEPSLLLEYVDGPSLDLWLARHRDPRLAQSIFSAICAGMAEVHAAGLVHRDIKPSNIILASLRGSLVPKVADFGLVLEPTITPPAFDRAGVGTPAYMAPEQLRDARLVDARADVFSLGCVLYELLSGSPPFTGDDPVEVLNHAAAGRYQPLTDAPARLRSVVEQCLKSDRNARPTDADAVLRSLETDRPGARRLEAPTIPPEDDPKSAPPPAPPRPEPPAPTAPRWVALVAALPLIAALIGLPIVLAIGWSGRATDDLPALPGIHPGLSAGGTVEIDGDPSAVQLIDTGGRIFSAGTVPPGSYRVASTSPDTAPRHPPLTITVGPATTVRLDCRDRDAGCRVLAAP
jgi:serine/threonine protein kinase